MADYKVHLDMFAGPLDLLLYLVRKDEVDVYDIPIAQITKQYIDYIEMLKKLDIDLASSFIVMAATLMHIKSAMLLPKADIESDDGDSIDDPRTELVRQLLEYKKFKDAANMLDASAQQAAGRFHRPDTVIQKLKPDTAPELDIELVNIWDLLEAFDNICKATGTFADYSTISDDTPIDLYQIEVLARLQDAGPLPFEALFQEKNNRLVLVGIFLALLELIRDELITIQPHPNYKTFKLAAATDEAPELAVRKTVSAAENFLEHEITDQDVENDLADKATKPMIPIAEIKSSSSASRTIEQIQITPERGDSQNLN